MYNFLLPCAIGCKKQGHTSTSTLLTSIDNFDSNDLPLTPDTFFISIQLSLSYCKKKISLLNTQLSAKRSIHLKFIDVCGDTIDSSLDFLKPNKNNISSLSIEFTQMFSKFKKQQLDQFFAAVQSIQSLQNLSIQNSDDFIKFSPSQYKTPLFVAIPQSALSHLKSLHLTFSLNQLNLPTLQALTKAATASPTGILVDFKLSLSECQFESNEIACVSRILYHNQSSLASFSLALLDITLNTSSHPINDLGKVFPHMKNLTSLSFEFRQTEALDQEEEEKVQHNLNLTSLFKGIKQISKQLNHFSINANDIQILGCSKIGSALANTSEVSFAGLMTLPLATEMGVELGKSICLQELKLQTDNSELGLLLAYAVHFSKSIKYLDLSFGGAKVCLLTEELNRAISSNSSLEKLSISFSYPNASIKSLKKLAQAISKSNTIKELSLDFINGKGTLPDLYNFFDELKAATNLELLDLSLGPGFQYDEQSFVDIHTENIIKPLHLMEGLQEINLSLDFSFKSKLLQLKNEAKLINGLIGHPFAASVFLSTSIESLEEFQNEYSLEYELLMYQMIAFNRIFGPDLLYNPARHVEDLYF